MSSCIVNTNAAAIHVTESGVGEPALVFLHWGGSSEDRRASMLDSYGSREGVQALSVLAGSPLPRELREP
jgi:hypothetical protein